MTSARTPSYPFRGTGAEVQAIEFAYTRSPDQDAAQPAQHPIVVVGAGPVGLSMAIDMAQRGHRVLVLDNDHRLSIGSRALCFSKRALEIWDRLGVGQPMVDKGVSWNLGKVFFHDKEVYQFNLLPEEGHERPAFINLQQYYCEAYLVERCLQLPGIELRWDNKVTGVAPRGDGALLSIETPDGPYQINADWVIACDGARSTMRGLMGLESKGRIFQDRFLIADVKMKADFPAERWFWFDPPFHPGQSVLLHREPDDVWRIDFQLGWDADPEEEKKPENIIPRVQALLGKDTEFTLEWASVYTFACLRMDSFVHGRVLFAGDCAHGVSPFRCPGRQQRRAGHRQPGLEARLGAQGLAQAPSCWPPTAPSANTLPTRTCLNSTRATDFITPKSEISRLFRDAALDLAREHPFARRIVNSGRLSVPAVLHQSPLNTSDADQLCWHPGARRRAAGCARAPQRPQRLAAAPAGHGLHAAGVW